MRTLGLLACGLSIFALASTAGASPLAGSVLKGLTAADMGLIEPIHGCHREVLFDRGGWHYHRRNCRRVEVPPQEYGPYGPGAYGPGPYGPYYEPYDPRPCFWAGPIRVCP